MTVIQACLKEWKEEMWIQAFPIQSQIPASPPLVVAFLPNYFNMQEVWTWTWSHAWKMRSRQGHEWEQPSDVIIGESHSSDMSGSDGPGWLEQLKVYSTP